MTNDTFKLQLLPVELADGVPLAELRVRTMQHSLTQVGRFDPDRARDRFLQHYVPDCTRHIVMNGNRVGFLVVRPQYPGLLLDHLYIDLPHQSRGIGAWALAQVFSEADALGLCLRVGALNGSRSNSFYQRHGFKLVEQGEWDNYYLRLCPG